MLISVFIVSGNKTVYKIKKFAIFYNMKDIFANYMEADKYYRKHFCLPNKVKHYNPRHAITYPATDKRPAIPDLDMGASFEYHGRKCTGAATPMKYAFKDAQGNWSMKEDFKLPWIYVDVETWVEIPEEEFINRINEMLKD